MNNTNDYDALMANEQFCRMVKMNNGEINLFYYGEFLNLKRTWKNEFKSSGKEMKLSGSLENILKNRVEVSRYKVWKKDTKKKREYLSTLTAVQRDKKITEVLW